jgi:poly(beta-D-mannuronate) lyase
MIKQLKIITCIVVLLSACSSGPNSNNSTNSKANVVKDISEFNEAAKNAKPGAIITIANGVWKDVEFRIEANGSKDSLITIQAETPGEVIITGESNIAFSGEFILVSGLVFKDGYTPTSEVISFKTSKDKLANYSRVTNCVIDNFSNPERFDADTWVGIYGKNNQFDHNSLIGKGNRGVTLAVRMITEASHENNHIIDHNYFGPRQTLGSNGGESFRIGTSHYSRSYSNTTVSHNYFDRTSGELEIISNKSCGNNIQNNVFFECKGTLTMRHGHHTSVENNYFLGNRKPNTGGIRVINEYQTVKNNYLFGLTGYRFRSALVMMNGVPNSPINRYNQVVDSKIENNVVVDSDNIQLCAGSDEERSATPIGSSFSNNIILTSTNANPFTIYDDVSGIEFAGNILNNEANAPFEVGFEKVAMSVSKNANGLLSPSQELLDKIEFGELKLPISKEEVGADYYAKDENIQPFGSGKTTNVKPGMNTLIEAIVKAGKGDILQLENGGEYLLTKYAMITKPISIVGLEEGKATILSEKGSFFKIENGGALKFKNILFDGSEAPDRVGNNVITTSKYSMNENYAVVIENCEVKDLDKNHSFDFLRSYKHTFADSIVIRNTKMTNITGAVVSLDMEVEDLGIYNAERVFIENSSFTDVQGAIANVYRGGTDESTFGPIVNIEGVKINNSGNGKRNKIAGTLRFHGVQKLNIKDVEIDSSKGIDLHHTNGEPVTTFSNISFVNSSGLKANNKEYKATNITVNN